MSKRHDDVSGLTQLGSRATEYRRSNPSADILETFQNAYPGEEYVIQHTTKEFSSLCPVTKQPDFAKIKITMVPHLRCVETKSLKLYLFAYRDEQSFMETICNRILADLVTACDPSSCHVVATYRPRGGIQTKVMASYMSTERVDEEDE